jgi:cytochrome c-type protein NapC
MQWNLEEYKETIHYQNASGVRATCSDCHVPKTFLPKMVAKLVAAKDVYHELLGTISTKEKFEKHRWDMANRVWAKMKASDSRECRSCHAWEGMDLSEQDRLARKKHGRSMDSGKTCIDCHKGIAHEEPEEPDEEDLSKTSLLTLPKQ